MGIEAIHHITINMTEKEKSFWFYGEVLGLKKLEEADMGDHYIYYYQLPGGCKLELIEYRYETETIKAEPVSRGIYRHFALKTDNIEEIYRKLSENEITILEGPKPNETLGVKFMLIQEPNGVEMEFVEPL